MHSSSGGYRGSNHAIGSAREDAAPVSASSAIRQARSSADPQSDGGTSHAWRTAFSACRPSSRRFSLNAAAPRARDTGSIEAATAVCRSIRLRSAHQHENRRGRLRGCLCSNSGPTPRSHYRSRLSPPATPSITDTVGPLTKTSAGLVVSTRVGARPWYGHCSSGDGKRLRRWAPVAIVDETP
jgi:hypothetical protein